MDSATRVQILDMSIYIIPTANTLEKGMHPTIFPQTLGKIVGKVGILNLLLQLIHEKENS